jgi:hypothetical protein
MPGYRSNPEDVSLGKKLVERLKLKADGDKKSPLTKRNGAAA